MDGAQSEKAWLIFALTTVVAWGLYGPLLHAGSLQMNDAAHGRLKAFLFVGIAYFLTAVLAPLGVLAMRGADWQFPAAGIGWALFAGVLGAAGAFCVLLAFGAKGHPGVVMSIIFAGAPVVNAIYLYIAKPPEAGISSLRWQFIVGLLMAALGGCLVTLYRPEPAKVAVKAAAPTKPAAGAAYIGGAAGEAGRP